MYTFTELQFRPRSKSDLTIKNASRKPNLFVIRTGKGVMKNKLQSRITVQLIIQIC